MATAGRRRGRAVEQLEQQLSRAQIGEYAAGGSAAVEHRDEAEGEDLSVALLPLGIAVDDGESSEDEFVPRQLRPAECRKRRARCSAFAPSIPPFQPLRFQRGGSSTMRKKLEK